MCILSNFNDQLQVYYHIGLNSRVHSATQISCLVYDTACRVSVGDQSGTPIMCSYNYNMNFNECEDLCHEWNRNFGEFTIKPCAGFQTYATRSYPLSPGECFLIKGNEYSCPEDGNQIDGNFLAAFSNQICADPFRPEPTSCYAVFDGFDDCDEASGEIQNCPDATP